MPAKFIPGEGWVIEEEQNLADEMGRYPVGAGVLDRQRIDDQQRAELEMLQREQQIQQDQSKPFIGWGTVGDVVKSVPNNVLRMGTDLLDLAAGVGDLASETSKTLYSKAILQEEDPYQFNDAVLFDDSDNPWTQWRRSLPTGRMSTGLGEMIDLGGGIAASAVMGKWATNPQGFVARTAKLGKVFERVRGAQTAYRTAAVTDKVSDVAKTAVKGSNLGKAANLASKNDYLSATYKAIANSSETATWWQNTAKTASAYAKTKISPRNLAETVAWDLWGTFNVLGEGDDQMDETIFDLAADLGVAVPMELQTTAADSALARKLKGMLDGTLIGTIGGGLVDAWRISRFSKQFKNASKADQQKLIKAFETEADELGRGVARLATGAKRFELRGDPDSAVQRALEVKEWEAQTLTPSRFPQLDGRRLTPEEVEREPSMVNRSAYTLDPWTLRLPQPNSPENLVDRWAETDLERIANSFGSRLETLTKAIDAERLAIKSQNLLAASKETDGIKLARVEGRQYPGEPDPNAIKVQVYDPTVTPQTLRTAVLEAMKDGWDPESIRQYVGRLIPERRASQFEYVRNAQLKVNEVGMLDPADSIWMNQITKRALGEGWGSIDPNTFELKFNRAKALELDQGDKALQEAMAIDEALDVQRYDEFLSTRTKTDSIDSPVQRQLGKMEAGAIEPPTDAADYEAWLKQRDGLQQDPTIRNDSLKAVEAELEAKAIAEDELSRIAVAAKGDVGEAELVSEMLGIDLDTLPTAQIAKAETGRGWEVYGVDGEVIGRATTKTQATKLAEKESNRLRTEVIGRARQQGLDATDEVVDLDGTSIPRDGDVIGKVTLTDKQIEEIARYPNFQGLSRQLEQGKKTFELSQAEMDQLQQGFKALLQTGEIKGPRARVIKNLAEKLDLEVQRIAPEVRVKRTADSLIQQTKRFLDHGDYC